MKNCRKIVLATYGTRGDIQPLLALALALGRKGHKVLLAAPPEHAAWIESHGCSFRSLGSDFRKVINRFPHMHTLRPLIFSLGFFRHELRKQLSQLPVIIEGADLVLGASLSFGLRTAAELMRIPCGFIAMTPQILPSAYHPFIAVKAQKMPPCLNRLSWGIARLADKFNLTAVINKERRDLNLSPVKDVISHVLGNHVMIASDPVLADIPPDIRLDCTQTGYLHLEPRQVVHDELEKFFASGPAPLYFGFGSMSTRDEEALVSLILKCLQATGQRGILTGFEFDKSEIAAPEGSIFVEEVPHALLFERLAAVVHHGGAGTTAAAARAGVPQIIVPHILDQYYWAEKIYRGGLGPKPIRRSHLTAGRLAKAINECVSHRYFYRRAKAAAEIIETQDSQRLAVNCIEKTFFSDLSSHQGTTPENS